MSKVAQSDKFVRIESDLQRLVKTVASSSGLSIRDYLGSVLRPIVRQDLEKFADASWQQSRREARP